VWLTNICDLQVFIGTLNKQLNICQFDAAGNPIENGCYNLVPVYDWIKRCIISILYVSIFFGFGQR
jgi:1,3-beta-glucan synthase